MMSVKKEKLSEEINNVKVVVLSKINSLVKESSEESLKVKLTQTKNVVLTMEKDKLSLLRLKQLQTDLN